MANVPYSLAIGPARQAPVVTTRKNFIQNPSFESDISSWGTSGGGTATLSQDSTISLFGSKCLRIDNSSVTVSSRLNYIPTVSPSASAGQTWTASAYFRMAGTNTRDIHINIEFYNSSLSPLSTIFSAIFTVNNTTWTRGSVTAVAPANTAFVRMSVNYYQGGSIAANPTLVDGVLLEQSATLNPYFDGDTPDTSSVFSWDGVPNLSTSTAQTVTVTTNTTPTQSLATFDSWTLTRNLDDGCSMTVQMPANSISGVQIKELETDIWIYKNGVAVDRFRVTSVDQEWGENGENRLAVQAVCYRRLLASRYVLSSLSFSDSQGQIVWNLIQHTQGQANGDLGITLGSTGPNIFRSRAYQPGQNILEAITDLTQADGNMTWDIDANLQLNVSTAGAYPLRSMPAQLGTNLRNIAKPSGASLFGNVALVSGDAQFTTLEIQNAPSILTDTRGRWEKYRSFSQEQVQSNLTEQAEGLVESTQSPSVIWSFEMISDRFFTDSDYQVGDFVVLAQPSTVVPSQPDPTIPYLTVAGQLILVQILTVDLTIDANAASSVKITAVQAPQTWDALPTTLTWNSIDPTVTWNDMLSTYFT